MLSSPSISTSPHQSHPFSVANVPMMVMKSCSQSEYMAVRLSLSLSLHLLGTQTCVRLHTTTERCIYGRGESTCTDGVTRNDSIEGERRSLRKRPVVTALAASKVFWKKWRADLRSVLEQDAESSEGKVMATSQCGDESSAELSTMWTGAIATCHQ